MSNEVLQINSENFELLQAIINNCMSRQVQSLGMEIKDILGQNDKLNSMVEGLSKKIDLYDSNLPLFAVECDRLTSTVKSKGVSVLGGKKSNAYRDPSLRGKVYSDIHHQLKREFSVTSFKAIKRNQIDIAVSVIEAYQLPHSLEEEIRKSNQAI